MIDFKFLRLPKKHQHRFHRYTNIYNRLDCVQLPWKEYEQPISNPKIFRGSFIQFVAKYRTEGFLPVMYEMQLQRVGWYRQIYSISRPLDQRIRKNDRLIICYDEL